MNFDKIITSVLPRTYLEKYRLGNDTHHIRKKFIHKQGSSSLFIVLPPWGDGAGLPRFLTHHLVKLGNSCLVYSFPRSILSPDPKLTLKIFHEIAGKIKTDIALIKQKYNFQQIEIIAPSLGCVSGLMTANGNKDVTGLYLIAPGSCLASSLWDGIRTRKLKGIYENKNINKEYLKILWQSIAPKNNLNALKDKKIILITSKSDKIIPYCYGKELGDLLKKQYPETVIQENRYLGHYLTTIKFYLFPNVWMKKL